MPSPSPQPRLRLLIVNYEFPPVGGGASYASLGLARTLTARGHSVEVLTSRLAGQPSLDQVEGFTVHRVASWRHGPHDCGIRGAATFVLCALLRLRGLLRERRYDLIHYFFGMPSGVLSFYTQGRLRIPYVISLRGSDVPDYDPTDRTLGLMHRLLARVNRRIWRNARAVVPNSAALGELAAAFEPALPYPTIPNAVIDADELRARPARQASPVKVLCVARLIERKGIGTLLAAVQRLGDLDMELHLVGGGRDEQRLRAHASAGGPQSKVIIHGAMPHDAVMKMCEQADVFVLPTLSESCSMALLEAMSRGLPIITTRAGGNPSLIRDGINGLLVEPGSVDQLADALRQLVESPSRRDAMSQANLATVAAQFTWGVNAERYEQVYRAALAAA